LNTIFKCVSISTIFTNPTKNKTARCRSIAEKTAIKKYSDSAHFVYELLQNAGDTKATWVEFDIDKNGFISNYTAIAKRLSEVSNKLKFGKSTGVEGNTEVEEAEITMLTIFNQNSLMLSQLSSNRFDAKYTEIPCKR